MNEIDLRYRVEHIREGTKNTQNSNTDEDFDKIIKKFAEGYGLTSIERAIIIAGINRLKAKVANVSLAQR